MKRATGAKSPIKQRTGKTEDRSRSRSQGKPVARPKGAAKRTGEEGHEAPVRVAASRGKGERVANYQELSFEDNVVRFMILLKARERGNVEGNAQILADIISTFGSNADISPEEIVGLVRRK